MLEIEFYDTEDGSTPVQEFLDSLEPKMKAKVFRTIDLLEQKGAGTQTAIFKADRRWNI